MSSGNEVVIITGGNNGIGFHMASSLLKDGYNVAVFDLFAENLSQLMSDHSDSLLFRKCDVTSDKEVKEAVDAVMGKWGRIDILVNNACIAVFKPFEEKSVEETKKEFEVNYFGYIRMIEAVLPHMKARKSGIIHNMSSGVGITGFSGIYGYASTKGAIEAMTRTLALEFEKYGICVDLMHPPITDTKSASPLGIPKEAMANPADIGTDLAKKIRSKKPVVAANFQTAAYLFLAYRFPVAVGRFFTKMTERSKKR
ncbi:short-chain dehydrogenase [Methanocella sp. CWC-04]|uniref:Short-chain dehydrogenase n=1 Tax=Methanooceanicella nereidis TaxID=2052831 RepID=A0AAP2RDI7_9EURY|nr:SDR family NAD(P)-dependent oxidoreductase [Methanocella sp. CWC-04]MCD1295269.1 short-chain dehydrogenase [Methanocella sp. CWC-04]